MSAREFFESIADDDPSAVLHDPDLLILDEPFSGLDPINVELLKEIVLDLKRAGKTIIFSTHQMEVAEKSCDDIC